VKTSDAELLAAAARAGQGVTAVRGASEVLALASEGFFDVLAAGTAANVRQFEPEPPRSAGDRLSAGTVARASVPEKRTEHVRSAGQHDGQLLAAAHAVAAYWLTASQVNAARAIPAAHSGEGDYPRRGLPPAVTITVNHVTPEGGLAAVELAHPDLGALALEVSLSGNTLSVLATAETEHAAAAIREGQAALAQQLQAQGITLQALSVVVLRRRVKNPEPKSKRQES
jgi:Flagellar hook-length control protein FliK